MLRFSCPSCKAHLRASEDKQGSTVICPKCKKRLQVPAAEAPEEPEEIEEIEELEERPPERPKRPAEKRPAPRRARDEEEEQRSTPRRLRDEEEEEEEETKKEGSPRKRRRPRPVGSGESGGGGFGVLGSILGWVIGVVLVNVIGCCGWVGWVWFMGSREEARSVAEQTEKRANPVVVNAAQLLQEFQDQPQTAHMKYENRFLEITGMVDRVGVDREEDSPYAILQGGAEKASMRIRCVFNSRDPDDPVIMNLKKGQQITIRGDYLGMGRGNVQIDDCDLLR